MKEPTLDNIIALLQEKVFLKQEVYDKTKSVFEDLKKQLYRISTGLKRPVKNMRKDLLMEYKDTGEQEAEFMLADETLFFVMHSNIFTFDNTHEIWKKKYVQEDMQRAYCGKIFIYNFLTDSFRFNRINDVGYLIARIFVNKEGHYFVEGKKQLGYLYNDFSSSVLNTDNLIKIIESAILYSLEFDPFTPPLEQINVISVKEMKETSMQSRIATGKRLGFQFEAEGNDIS